MMNHAQAYHKRTTGWLKGFTLPEVLASLVFAGIVLPVAVGGLVSVLATAENARRQAEACELAQTKMSELLATGTPALGSLTGNFGPEQPDYNWSSKWAQWEGNMLWQLDITVTWTSRGKQRMVQLSTLTYTGNT
jgi:type II secretory pathway pseudopilin PulG